MGRPLERGTPQPDGDRADLRGVGTALRTPSQVRVEARALQLGQLVVEPCRS